MTHIGRLEQRAAEAEAEALELIDRYLLELELKRWIRRELSRRAILVIPGSARYGRGPTRSR